MVAGVPGQSGIAWIALQYALGLRRLGHEVLLVEPVDKEQLRPATTPLASSENAAYFGDVVRQFGLEDEAALLLSESCETWGLTYDRIHDWARHADLVVNVGGCLMDPD
ncbi:MAG: glycosyltransferase, partial [Gemmatimonadota bacterium]